MKIKEHIENIRNIENYRYTYVIAEVGINHNGSLDEAIKLVEASAEAKVDAVKFQKRNLKNLYTQKILDNPNSAEWNFDYLLPILKTTELTEADYGKIKEKCDELGLELIITPFDMDSAEFCACLGTAAFKIGSADMINHDLISKCHQYNKPILISTGMWSEAEIKASIQKFKSIGMKDFVMLLANSTYPTPLESINLEFLYK